jgi:hypothetical protein
MRVSVVATGIESMEQTSPLPFINEPTMMPAQPVIQPAAQPSAVAHPQMQVNAFTAPVAETANMPANEMPVAPAQAEEPSADIAQIQALEAETAAAAEMPTMEIGALKAEEQLDLVNAVKSAEASDHKMDGTGAISTGAISTKNASSETTASAEEATPAIASKVSNGHEQATIIRRPLFIPDAPRDVGLDEELTQTDPVPEGTQRASLIHRYQVYGQARQKRLQQKQERHQQKKSPS